jgi:hypothetical protein
VVDLTLRLPHSSCAWPVLITLVGEVPETGESNGGKIIIRLKVDSFSGYQGKGPLTWPDEFRSLYHSFNMPEQFVMEPNMPGPRIGEGGGGGV